MNIIKVIISFIKETKHSLKTIKELDKSIAELSRKCDDNFEK